MASGLTGYAAAWKAAYDKAKNRGADSNTASNVAHAVASSQTGGSGMTPSQVNRITRGGGSSSYAVDPSTGQAVGIGTRNPSDDAFNSSSQGELTWSQIGDELLGVNQPVQRIPQLPALPGVPMRPTLTYEEALRRARGQYEPLYDESKKKILEALQESAIRRGFFGQLPAAEFERAARADLEAKKNQAIAQGANELVGRDEDAARAQLALDLQRRGQELQMAIARYNQEMQQWREMEKARLALAQVFRQREKEEEDDGWGST